MRMFLSSLKFRTKNNVQILGKRLSQLFKNDSEIAEERARTFRNVYRTNSWGHDGSEFYSGVGSRGEMADSYVKEIVPFLTQMKQENGGKLAVVDIGCGDFHVGRNLVNSVPGITYVGCDIVDDLINAHTKKFSRSTVSFTRLDIVCEEPPQGDVYLIRQVLQHLSNDEIGRALSNLRGKIIIVTESHPVVRTGSPNPDKVTGKDVRFHWWTGIGGSVELSQPPFNRISTELFRLQVSSNEVLVTEKLVP